MGNRTGTRRDQEYLRQALALAAKGRTGPNPMVGAVLVRGGRVLGRGFHAHAGGPHAEVLALAAAGRSARGARLYINLEPCCHFGRTPPCTDAIIAAGVREVIACMRDPNPRVNGRGFRALRAAGVRVRVGLLQREARRLNERFLRWARSGVPFVTLKAGMSLDGRIATRRGESKWITSPEARAAARLLRSEHDAVLVGVNTVIADDPLLTAPSRRSRGMGADGGRGATDPVRVILDSRLRTPPDARLLRGGRSGKTIILTVRGASRPRRLRLERAGAQVLEVPGRKGRVSLRHALAALGSRGIAGVLIEGGGEVLGSALDDGVGDRAVLFVARRLLGGCEARPAFGGLGAAFIGDGPRLEGLKIRSLGPDLMLDGRLVYPGRRRGG